MAMTPDRLSATGLDFVRERHLATLSSVRRDGSPHVVPVGFTWDAEAGLLRVITSSSSVKARIARSGRRVAVCQLEGPRWLTLEGPAEFSDDPERVAEAVRRYAERYRQPRENPRRVVIEVAVDRLLGSPDFFA